MATIRKRISKTVDEETGKTKEKTTYQVQVRLKGFPQQSASFDRLSDAKRWGQQTEAAIKEGRYFKTTEAKRHTLADLIDRYIETVLVPKKPKAVPMQKPQLLWWKDEIGVYALADVTPALIVEFRDKLSTLPTHQSEVMSPATVNRHLAALSHAFSIAVNEWGWIESNPVAKVKKLTESRGRVRFLDDEERARLLKACEESHTKTLYTVVMLALSTGMRKSEILNLYWREPKQPPTDRNGNMAAWGVVHLEQRKIILHDTKNGERRSIPLSANTLTLMKEHNKIRRLNSDLVFPGKNGKQSADIRDAWESALERAEIDNFKFHDLRHTAASYLAMNGASLAEIAEILGHKTLQMVKRYAHLSDSHVAGVLEDMNQKIFGG